MASHHPGWGPWGGPRKTENQPAIHAVCCSQERYVGSSRGVGLSYAVVRACVCVLWPRERKSSRELYLGAHLSIPTARCVYFHLHESGHQTAPPTRCAPRSNRKTPPIKRNAPHRLCGKSMASQQPAHPIPSESATGRKNVIAVVVEKGVAQLFSYEEQKALFQVYQQREQSHFSLHPFSRQLLCLHALLITRFHLEGGNIALGPHR